MRGRLDVVSKGVAYGWAVAGDGANPAPLEFRVDGHAVGHCVADQFRADLRDAGIRDGHAGFIMPLPTRFRDGGHHVVEVAHAEGGFPLDGCPFDGEFDEIITASVFARHAPWLDADDARFRIDLDRKLASGECTPDEASQLVAFRRDGFTRFERVVPESLIDRLVADIETCWQERIPLQVVEAGNSQPVDLREIQRDARFRHSSFRYLDIHNVSVAAARIMCLPPVIRFIEQYLGQPVTAMQSLLFENGTQQAAHQDFPYVHSAWPASMAGAWFALEDVNPAAGPLFYYPGSHRLVRPYAFPDGSVIADGDGPHVRLYERYLEEECSRLGLVQERFLPRKGDVLLWHSALVHGGSARIDPGQSRRSIVFHYTPQAAYPKDRRHPDALPVVLERNGCRYFASQAPEHAEGRLGLPENTET